MRPYRSVPRTCMHLPVHHPPRHDALSPPRNPYVARLPGRYRYPLTPAIAVRSQTDVVITIVIIIISSPSTYGSNRAPKITEATDPHAIPCSQSMYDRCHFLRLFVPTHILFQTDATYPSTDRCGPVSPGLALLCVSKCYASCCWIGDAGTRWWRCRRASGTRPSPAMAAFEASSYPNRPASDGGCMENPISAHRTPHWPARCRVVSVMLAMPSSVQV